MCCHRLSLTLLLGMLWASFAPPADGQTTIATDEVGINPYGSYEGGNIDQISMNTGNVFLRVPLYSLPQRGRLQLSYSLVANDQGYRLTRATGGATVIYMYQHHLELPQVNVFGAMPILDQDLALTNKYNLQAQLNEFRMHWYLRDSLLTLHSMGVDAINTQRLRSTDGSGYMAIASGGPPYDYFKANLYISASCHSAGNEDL